MSKSTFIQYLESLACLDEPLGDFATDALRDKNFSLLQSEHEMINYLKLMADRHGHEEIFKELIKIK